MARIFWHVCQVMLSSLVTEYFDPLILGMDCSHTVSKDDEDAVIWKEMNVLKYNRY